MTRDLLAELHDEECAHGASLRRIDQLEVALNYVLESLDRLRGYRCAEQDVFLAHIDSLQQRIRTGVLFDERVTGGRDGSDQADVRE